MHTCKNLYKQVEEVHMTNVLYIHTYIYICVCVCVW
jgi:hypothetical protein